MLGESTDGTLKSAVVLINCSQHLNQDQFTEANRYKCEVLDSVLQSVGWET